MYQIVLHKLTCGPILLYLHIFPGINCTNYHLKYFRLTTITFVHNDLDLDLDFDVDYFLDFIFPAPMWYGIGETQACAHEQLFVMTTSSLKVIINTSLVFMCNQGCLSDE